MLRVLVEQVAMDCLNLADQGPHSPGTVSSEREWNSATKHTLPRP